MKGMAPMCPAQSWVATPPALISALLPRQHSSRQKPSMLKVTTRWRLASRRRTTKTNIADFSGRGLVFWEEIGEIIEPDVSTPGVDILSSIPGGGHARFQGTSTACPHVAETVALMISLARSGGVDSQLDVDFFQASHEENGDGPWRAGQGQRLRGGTH